MSIFKRGNVYWFHFLHDGQHFQESTRQGNKNTARQMEAAFKQSNYEGGVVAGVQAVTRHLAAHFPANGQGRNELPDAPVVLQGSRSWKHS